MFGKRVVFRSPLAGVYGVALVFMATGPQGKVICVKINLFAICRSAGIVVCGGDIYKGGKRVIFTV